MEQRKDPKPVVRHMNNRPSIRAFESVLKKFSEAMIAEYQKMLVSRSGEDLPWQTDNHEDLLALRKMLRDAVAEGMLERKDQEEAIAILAVMVWFQRQEVTRKHEILMEWSL